MRRKQSHRPKLRLVYSAPPAEPLSLVATERNQHVASWSGGSRNAERHLRKLQAIDHRVCTARVVDADDARAALLLAYYDFNLRSVGINHDCPQLQRGADLIKKVIDWFGVPPGDGPKLVG